MSSSFDCFEKEFPALAKLGNILDADPAFIFVVEQGKSTEAQESFAEAFSGKPVWQELAAVRNGCVYMLPKDYFQYKPNAKWDEAYQYVMELLEE